MSSTMKQILTGAVSATIGGLILTIITIKLDLPNRLREDRK